MKGILLRCVSFLLDDFFAQSLITFPEHKLPPGCSIAGRNAINKQC